jgi:hypothetical protein
MLITISGVHSQTMEKGYLNYLQQNDLKKVQPFEYRIFPKPLSIKKNKNKVVVEFDRKEWDRLELIRMRRSKGLPHRVYRKD